MMFSKMMQLDGEPIMQFVARLKAQAALCQFSVCCSNHSPTPLFISYINDMVAQQLIAGLRNNDYQSKILSESASLPTLASKVDRLRCLEASQESLVHFRPAVPTMPSQVSAARNVPYRPTPKVAQPPSRPSAARPQHKTCRGCGKTSHAGKSLARKDCPAFGKVCSSCGIMGHFRAVCEKTAPSRNSKAHSANEGDNDDEHSSPQHSSFALTESETELDFRRGLHIPDQD